MASVTLSTKAVGSIVKLKVGGILRDFIVVHQGKPGSMYDASCDGTWLLMKDGYEAKRWHGASVNDYANSEINSYLNGPFLGLFDTNIQAQIKQVKIPYRAGSGYGKTVTSGSSGLSVKIFLLSLTEANIVDDYGPNSEGACLAYFAGTSQNGADNKRIANLNGSAAIWWTRSPCCDPSSGAMYVMFISANGNRSYGVCGGSVAIRPALVLPSSLLVSDDGSVSTNTAPTTPSSISVPGSIQGGSTITISWGASTDAESNLEGYIVERSTNGGTSWTQIYQGSAQSTTNNVAFGTASVMYRVKAYDTEGLNSGWRTGGQVMVVNNTAPTIPNGIHVPEQVQGGQPLTITWGEAYDGENNLSGYSLERQVNGGGWNAIYSGPERSFADQIVKGWKTVAYRVQAYDNASAYSGFTVSEPRTVNNNTPPAIACEWPTNSSLGVKSNDFTVSYSVEDEEGDEVSVIESVNGTTLWIFTVELGAENSFQLHGADFMKLLNGPHTLSISAEDGASSAVHSLFFTKEVTQASVTLEQPMEADGPISVCVLGVTGFIPGDAEYKVEVTNNGLDDEPVWEDCTAAVQNGSNYVFENDAAEKGFAFNFRLNVNRGLSGTGGYITSVQGGFQ